MSPSLVVSKCDSSLQFTLRYSGWDLGLVGRDLSASFLTCTKLEFTLSLDRTESDSVAITFHILKGNLEGWIEKRSAFKLQL